MRPPLIVTGPPAAGKTSTARRLARVRQRCAVIDVDDLRHLVVAGHAAPWQGTEGRCQQQLGVENACAIARRLAVYQIEVIIADMLSPETTTFYRRLLPTAVLVHLQLSVEEARRRATGRIAYLTDEEFTMLHVADQTNPPPVDQRLDVSRMNLDDQVAAIDQVWRNSL
jgi:adenylylsulfate kinase-like enzyme